MIKGPIIIVEDDKDDQELYSECIKSIGISNEIKFFSKCEEALKYLVVTEDQPFIILSDVNLPGMTGLDLKRHMQDDPFLVTKGIPFVFISTDASRVAVRHAHALSVQGYFQKPNKLEEIRDMFQTIFTYWTRCRHINNT